LADGPGSQHAADRVGQIGNRLEPLGDRLEPLGVEREPVKQCRREALALGLFEVAGIGGEDLVLPAAHCSSGLAQCRDLGFGGGECKRGRRQTGTTPDFGHRRCQIRL